MTVSETGRSKLTGVHAGLVLLAPLGDDSSNAIHHAPTGPSHTPLEPPPSILHSAYSAIKDAISHVVPSHAPPAPTSYAAEHHEHHENQEIHDHPPPPPPPPVPPFKPMQWPAFNSYGEPAAPDSYSDYSPLQNYNTVPSYDHYAAAKHSKTSHYHQPGVSHGLTPEKLRKIQKNLDKLAHLNLHQRSSEEQPQFNALEAYRLLFEKGSPLLPTPVVDDAEIGVLPAAVLPTELPTLPSSPPSPTVTTTTPTTAPPTDEKTRRRKEAKFVLRGNKIVIV